MLKRAVVDIFLRGLQIMKQLGRIDRVFGPSRHSVRDIYKALLEEKQSGMEAEWIDYAIKVYHNRVGHSHYSR